MLQMVARLDVGTVTTCAGSATTPPLYIYNYICIHLIPCDSPDSQVRACGTPSKTRKWKRVNIYIYIYNILYISYIT